MTRPFVIASFVLTLIVPAVAQDFKGSTGIQIAPTAPAIPQEMIYSLGQQNGQIVGLTTRIERLDTKVDGMQNDITRLNVYAALGGVLIVGLLVPLGRSWLTRRIHGPNADV